MGADGEVRDNEGGCPHGGVSRVVVSFMLTTIQAEATLQCTGCRGAVVCRRIHSPLLLHLHHVQFGSIGKGY